LKNGASNVEPDPVRVGAWPPGPVPVVASADAGAPGALVPLAVAVQAARASRVTMAPTLRVVRRAGWVVW
jgi:hypothetical protein